MRLLLFFCLVASAQATVFVRFSVTEQLARAPYVVYGRVGEKSVDYEPSSGEPYTYWNFFILESFGKKSLQGDIVIRQPGGVLGDAGYKTFGTATFIAGEEAIVLLRDTTEEAKEVIGLASGKYAVRVDDSGREYLRNGLGNILQTRSLERLGVEDFRDLMERVKSGRLTQEDKTLGVGKKRKHYASGRSVLVYTNDLAVNKREIAQVQDKPAPVRSFSMYWLFVPLLFCIAAFWKYLRF